MRTQAIFMESTNTREKPGSSSANAGAQPVKRGPGRPPIANPKQAISLRLEPAVLEKFRATGPGWQRRINDVLKAAELPEKA